MPENMKFIHCNNSQWSIHPAIKYYKDVSNILQEKSFSFILEDLKCGTAFYEVMSTDCKYVKQNYQHIKNVKWFDEIASKIMHKGKGGDQ